MLHCITIALALAPAFARSTSPPNGAAAFLARQSIIRMFVDDSPGMGHQAASATVVRRLRELGFDGWFEIVYSGNAHNLEVLPVVFPGFQPVDTPVEEAKQEIVSSRLRFFRSDHFLRNIDTMAEVDFGVLGGDDLKTRPEKLRVRALLTLQPTHWHKIPRLQIRYSRGVDQYDLAYLNAVPFAAVPMTWSEVEQSMVADRELTAKMPTLRAFAKARERVDLLTYYGRAPFDHWAQLGRVVRGLRWARAHAPQALRKPIVIAVLNAPSQEVDPDQVVEAGIAGDYKTLVKALGGSVRVAYAEGGLDFERLRADEIVLLHVGRTAGPAFDWLMRASDLPPVVRGHNSADLMAQLGRPYLGSGTVVTQHFTSDTPDRLVQRAQTAMTEESTDAPEALGRFFAAALDHGSAVSKLFRSEGVGRRADNDKVTLGLTEVIRHWEDVGRSASDVNPLVKRLKVATSTVSAACANWLAKRSPR